jgi:thiol-disulfide isomerase/thioredoxin
MHPSAARRILVLAAVAWLFSFPAGSSAWGEEKAATPLSGGVPLIEGIKMLEVGADGPDFAVKDTNGEIFNFAVENTKAPSLLVFWSIFCEPCRFEMPIVQRLHEKYGNGSLNVLAVVLDGEPLKNSIVGFVRQEGYTFRILIDELDAKETFKVADPYGVAGTPTIILVDRGGKVAFSRVGRLKEEELERVVLSLVKK